MLKKLTYILVFLLLSMGGGLFSGCQTVYDRMKLELSVEEIELYLPLENEEIIEGTEEALITDSFTATVSNVPDKILKEVTYQTTNDGIISVEMEALKEDTTTINITALRPGRTDLIIRTVEGNKQQTVSVFVIKQLEDMQVNTSYKLAVPVGTPTSINTAQAINFYPINTNQKEVVYSLAGEVEGVTITEAGEITVTEKTVQQINVIATSVANENLSVSFDVEIIQPILSSDVILTTDKQLALLAEWLAEGGLEEEFNLEVTNGIMANNNEIANNGSIIVRVDSSETYNILAYSSSTDVVEVVEVMNTGEEEYVVVKANNLGTATITIRVEIDGYPNYYAVKTFSINVVNYATSVMIGSSSTARDFTIYNNYAGGLLGKEIQLAVGPVSAYSKQIRLQIAEEDQNKIIIRYSDGTVIDSNEINNTVLPRGLSLFISSNYLSTNPDPLVRAEENTVELYFIANSVLGEEVEVMNTAIFHLTQGPTDLIVPGSISLKQGLENVNDYPDVSFNISPVAASNEQLTVEVVDTSIVSAVMQTNSIYKIIAKNKGTTTITVSTVNGIVRTMQVEVYVELAGLALSIPSPEQNYSVAERELDATPGEYESLLTATIAIGAGIPMSVYQYPSNASIVSIVYTSSNTAVATINNNGYITTKSIGTSTITATITSKQYQDETTSEEIVTQKSFVLTTYVPIDEINLNALQIELYEENSVGYFDIGKSSYQLSVSINPSNATFNQDDITWSSVGNYINVDETGLVTASVPLNVSLPNNTATATVTASIVEYGRYYAKTCVITIKRAVMVDSITVYNVPEGYVYFDARDGLGQENTKQLEVQTYPYTATNSNVRYVYIQDALDEEETPVFTVSETGLITPVRAGIATLHVVAEDSYIDLTHYSRYNEIIVKVADGLTEETALEVSSVSDVLDINTIEELALHYVLAASIDFTNVTFNPIGLIGGTAYEFTGSFNGKFEYAGINKQYKIKGLGFNSTTPNLTSTVAFFANNGGTLKNLELEIASIEINGTNDNLGSVLNLAGLTATNNGTIENVMIHLISSEVFVAAQTAYVGLIAAQNNGDIIDSVAYGNLNVGEAESLSITPTVFVGGLVGMNYISASLVGSYVPTSKEVEQVEEVDPDYSNVLYQKEGMNSFATVNASLLTNENSAAGLAVGLNYGSISNVATDGIVEGYYNVGGIVGKNVGLIENSYSASQVVGTQNVGGLIGYATEETVNTILITSEIINNAVEIYDRTNTYEAGIIGVQGRNNVGGLIGFADSIAILQYNYVSSYFLRTLGVNYDGDIVLNYLDETQDFIVGGLIGRLENVSTAFTQNYVNATLATTAPSTSINTPTVIAGGLIGFVEGDFNISNSYTTKQIALPALNSVAGKIVGEVINAPNSTVDYVYSTSLLTAETTGDVTGMVDVGSNITITNSLVTDGILTTDFASWDIENSGIWYQVETINNGYPVLYNSQNNLLINEAPEVVTVTVIDSSFEIEPGDGSISIHHLKVTDKQAVVMLTEDEYYIRDIINTNPVNYRYYLSTEDTDIVQILDEGKIKVLQEGTATIRVSSFLNTNIFDTFELAVIKGFTNFSLSQSQDKSTGELSSQTTLQIKLNESILLYSALASEDYTVSSNTGVIYEATTSDFTINGLTLNATIGNIATHILTAGSTPSDGDIEVTVTPYIKVMLDGVETIVTIDSLQKAFKVNVYEGASVINTSLSSATIGLREELELEVYVTTDKASEEINILSQVLEGEEDVLNYITAEFAGSELVEGSTDEYIYRYIIKAREDFLQVNSGSGNFKSAKSGVLVFTPSSNSELSASFNISITPQDLLRIDMAHYPTGETKISGGLPTYYPQELPSNIIAPGQPGILKINLYPEYANIDYYEIVSSTTGSGQYISFQQVALINTLVAGVVDNVAYSPVNPSPAGILYGSKLNLISTADKEDNVITYSFDGNIYVKTLISSSVVKGTVFTITLTGYRVDEEGVSHVNLSKEIGLTVDSLPGISLLYEGQSTGQVARGTQIALNLSLTSDYEGVIEDPTAIININNNIDKDALGNDITIHSLSSVIIEKVKEGLYYLEVRPGVPSGSTITVTATVKRTINGILEQDDSVLTLKVVDFIVEGIRVKRAEGTTSENKMNLYVGQSTALQVNLITNMWDTSSVDNYQHLLNATEYANLQTIAQNIENNLIKAENSLSRNMRNWYQQINIDPLEVVSLNENYNHTNFSISVLQEEDVDYDYETEKDIYINAKTVSTNTTLLAQVNFYYNAQGHFQSIVEDNNQLHKYPEIYTDETNSLVEQEYYSAIQELQFSFRLNITANSTEDRPIPIYSVQDLLNMQAGVDYILLSDKNEPLVLENWVPLTTPISSLDGNERIIQIKSFAADRESGDYNFGLFGRVDQDTILKNIKVDISLLVDEGGQIDATEFDVVNFGFIAGVNYGTITNADVLNASNINNTVTLLTREESDTTFGGLIGYNLGGYITNSRVGRMGTFSNNISYYDVHFKAYNNVAGFVGYNAGVVTSSYAANITLENLSESLQNSKTAGFVANNQNNARISQSFVEGIQTSIGTAGGAEQVIQEGGITSVGAIGGFVYENNGIINDSFANIPITSQSRSAGFVYHNTSSGLVNAAYSASKIVELTTANLPFVGSNSLEEILNEGILTNVYYLKNNNYFTSQFGGEYPAIAVEDFGNQVNFNGFGFLSEAEYEEYATWAISVNNKRPIIPALSELQITSSERVISEEEKIGDVVVEVYYKDLQVERGTGNNPILVGTASQFLEAMTMNSYLKEYKDGTTGLYINNNKIKLIRDIDFNEIVNDVELEKLQSIIFTGILDGNGMTLKNVRVLSSQLTNTQESFGMFYRIGVDYDDLVELDDTVIFNMEWDYFFNKSLFDPRFSRATYEKIESVIGPLTQIEEEQLTLYFQNKNFKTYIESQENSTVVKNLNVTVYEISATDSIRVGVLAGQISSSIILNVDISGQNITVQGRNLVGSLAGKITGDSRIVNISSNLSVSSEYRSTEGYSYYGEYDSETMIVTENNFSYAGGIAGVIDTYSFDASGEKITDIDWQYEKPAVIGLIVSGSVRIRGEKTGGVIGYVGPYTYIKDAIFEVKYIQEDIHQSLVGFEVTGGVVGQNSGYIDHIRIEHEADYQEEVIDTVNPRTAVGYDALFRENSNYIGGLVGYNDSGTIVNSYSRIDVMNTTARVAGGLIGVNYAGDLNQVYATGHVIGAQVIGGLIGIALEETLEYIDDGVKQSGDTLDMTDTFAINNWRTTAYALQIRSKNNTYDIGEDYIDANGNGIYDLGESHTDIYDLYFGAMIGEQVNSASITTSNNWYINEVFSVVGEATVEQTKYLPEIGNNLNTYASVIEAVEDSTQFRTITNLYLGETQDKYENFVAGSTPIWTLDSVRFPKLLFSNLESVITVTNETQLKQEIERNPYATIIVAKDIYLSEAWTPVTFKGILMGMDGVHPTIYNININSSASDVGFFSTIDSASILSLNFVFGGQVSDPENVNWQWTGEYVNGVISTKEAFDSTAGLLVGNASNSSIKNVTLNFANNLTVFNASSNYMGTIVGKAKMMNILDTNVESSGSFTINMTYTEPVLPVEDEYQTVYVGGAFGILNGSNLQNATVTNIVLTASSYGLSYIGGLVGKSQSTNFIDVNSNVIVNAEGDADSNVYMGGLIGQLVGGSVVRASATEVLTLGIFNDVYLGGLIGEVNGAKIEASYYDNNLPNSISSIESNNAGYVGGLVGNAIDTTIEYSHSIANIEVQNKVAETFIGGLVGKLKNTLSADVTLSYAKVNINANINAQVSVGGFIGTTQFSACQISEVYSQGNLYVTSSSIINAGGLIGYNQVLVEYAISVMNVKVISSSTQKVGGLFGRNSGFIENAFSYANVYSNQNTASYVNAVVGDNTTVNLSKVYYNLDLSGLTKRSDTDGAVAKTQTNLIDNAVNADEKFTKSTGTYQYLKNIDAPDLALGTLMHPKEVRNEADLIAMDGTYDYYIQTSNITTTATIDSFHGVLNGNGYTITYAPSLIPSGEAYLFKIINVSAMLTNVAIKANITLASNASNEYHYSGLAKANRGTIYASYAILTVNNNQQVEYLEGSISGLTYYNYGLIENSFAKIMANIKYIAGAGQYLRYLQVAGLVYLSDHYNNVNAMVNSSFATGIIQVEQVNTLGMIDYSNFIYGARNTIISNSYSTVVNKAKTVTYGLYRPASSTGVQVTNSYHDIYATGVDDSYDKPTVYMTSEQFKEDLEVSDRFNYIWKQDKTINYGYPYPYYLSSTYLNNPLKSGDGTYLEPLLINHAGRLDFVRTQMSTSKYFKQEADIDLTLFNEINGSFAPLGNLVDGGINSYSNTWERSFIGIYDGQNYTINALTQTFNGTADAYSGLFRSLEEDVTTFKYGYVYNVGLTNANIEILSTANMEKAYLGILTGKTYNTSIINCYTTGQIKDSRNKESNNGKDLYIGGLIGYAACTTIDKSFNGANVMASFGRIGGVAGIISYSSLTNSHNEGNISLVSYYIADTTENYQLGGVVAHSDTSNIYNVENSGTITVDALHYDDPNGYTLTYEFSLNNAGTGGVVGHMYKGTITHATNKGIVNFDGYSDRTSYHNTIGGVIGRTYETSVLETLSNEATLNIRVMSYGDINNMVGGVIGRVENNTTYDIEYIRNTATINANAVTNEVNYAFIGGLIGYVEKSNIRYSYNAGQINAEAPLYLRVGGLVGYLSSSITNSYNEGHLTAISNLHKNNIGDYATVCVGGLAGQYVTGQLIKIHNFGDITYERRETTSRIYLSYVGGIVGASTGSFSYSNYISKARNNGYILGKIVSDTTDQYLSVGGIAGATVFEINNSYNLGTVESDMASQTNTPYTGGIVGYAYNNEGIIMRVYTYADVLTSNMYRYYTGKIIGRGSYNTANDYYYEKESQIITSYDDPYNPAI